MRGRSLAVVCVLAVATFAGAQAPVATRGADVDSELEKAKSLVRDGRFAQAVAKLQGVVVRLEQVGQAQAHNARLGEAHLHLALAYLALDDPAAAKESLKALARVDPARRLDPEVYAPKVIALFEEARAESTREPASPQPGAPPSSVGAQPKKGSKTVPLLIAAGGAAGIGAALAAGGSTGSGSGSSTPTPPAASPSPVAFSNDVTLLASDPPSGSTLPEHTSIVFSYRYSSDRPFCLHVTVEDQGGNPCIGAVEVRPPGTGVSTGLRVSTGLDPRWQSCQQPSVALVTLRTRLQTPADAPCGPGTYSTFVEKVQAVSYTITR
jgi:hypothetical protein